MGCGCLKKTNVQIISNIKSIHNEHNNSIPENHEQPLLPPNNPPDHSPPPHINNPQNNISPNNNNNNNHNIISNPINENENIYQNINSPQNINPSQNIIENPDNNLNSSSSSEINNNYAWYEPHLQSKDDVNFNYKIIEDEFIGHGVKKMNAYISPVTMDELKKIRENFWTSRVEGNQSVWEILRLICSDNSLSKEDIKSIMKSSGITTYKGCINVCFDKKGALYEIPNYCINDPKKFDIISDTVENNKPKEEIVLLKIRSYDSEVKIKVSNYVNVEELKKNIENKINKKNCSFRLFFGGKELKDNKEIWSYGIVDKTIIQMLINKCNEENEKNDENVKVVEEKNKRNSMDKNIREIQINSRVDLVDTFSENENK